MTLEEFTEFTQMPKSFSVEIPKNLSPILELRFLIQCVVESAEYELDNDVIRSVLEQESKLLPESKMRCND